MEDVMQVIKNRGSLAPSLTDRINVRNDAAKRLKADKSIASETIKAKLPSYSHDQLKELKSLLKDIQEASCNGGGNITIPAHFQEIQGELQLICVHRNVYFGNKDTKTQWFGTTYTDTAKNLSRNIEEALKKTETSQLLGKPPVVHNYGAVLEPQPLKTGSSRVPNSNASREVDEAQPGSVDPTLSHAETLDSPAQKRLERDCDAELIAMHQAFWGDGNDSGKRSSLIALLTSCCRSQQNEIQSNYTGDKMPEATKVSNLVAYARKTVSQRCKLELIDDANTLLASITDDEIKTAFLQGVNGS